MELALAFVVIGLVIYICIQESKGIAREREDRQEKQQERMRRLLREKTALPMQDRRDGEL